MSTKDTVLNVGLLAAGGVAIAAASGVYGKGSRAKATASGLIERIKQIPGVSSAHISDTWHDGYRQITVVLKTQGTIPVTVEARGAHRNLYQIPDYAKVAAAVRAAAKSSGLYVEAVGGLKKVYEYLDPRYSRRGDKRESGFTDNRMIVEVYEAKGSRAAKPLGFFDIQAGDKVTISVRFGAKKTGTAVMSNSYGGWVLNMGGRYGTPGLATMDNVVKVTRPRGKGSMTRDGSYEATLMFDADEDDRSRQAQQRLMNSPFAQQARPLTAEPPRITSAQGSPARMSSVLRGATAKPGYPIPGPSLKTLDDRLNLGGEEGKSLKYFMQAGQRKAALDYADELLGGHGIEYIASEQDTMRSREGIEYVNMGDTYDTTLIYDYKTGRFYVGAWGDWVERYPKRFGY
jgi:hypothetical protein